MTISRRNFLKLSGVGLASVALGVPSSLAGTPSPVKAAAGEIAAPDSASMLYDGVKCVGCRACQMACKKRSSLPAETDSNQLYDAPVDLSGNTWTLIQLYQSGGKAQGPEKTSFVKKQCMHCVNPACVAACPVAALQKTESGPVVYHSERCIGCRYCMSACPFGVPKSQWDKALPYIRKCDFCADRQSQGKAPACGEACPTGALIYGTRKTMLETAHARLGASQDYVQHVYGETEAGGTAMVYIAGVGYSALGFPTLSDQALPDITWPYMRAVPWLIVGMASLSTAIYLRTHRNEPGAGTKEE